MTQRDDHRNQGRQALIDLRTLSASNNLDMLGKPQSWLDNYRIVLEEELDRLNVELSAILAAERLMSNTRHLGCLAASRPAASERADSAATVVLYDTESSNPQVNYVQPQIQHQFHLRRWEAHHCP